MIFKDIFKRSKSKANESIFDFNGLMKLQNQFMLSSSYAYNELTCDINYHDRIKDDLVISYDQFRLIAISKYKIRINKIYLNYEFFNKNDLKFKDKDLKDLIAMNEIKSNLFEELKEFDRLNPRAIELYSMGNVSILRNDQLKIIESFSSSIEELIIKLAFRLIKAN